MTDQIEAAERMIDDLCHTGELSMPYRCDIAEVMQGLLLEIRDLKALLDPRLYEAKEWGDQEDELTALIKVMHPHYTKDFDTWVKALDLVSNRHSKYALVDLVNYLLKRNEDAVRFKGLRVLCGYIENGTSQSIEIGQDDATRGWNVYVGKSEWFHGRSMEQAIDAAVTFYTELETQNDSEPGS